MRQVVTYAVEMGVERAFLVYPSSFAGTMRHFRCGRNAISRKTPRLVELVKPA
jgi:hypothetical protein